MQTPYQRPARICTRCPSNCSYLPRLSPLPFRYPVPAPPDEHKTPLQPSRTTFAGGPRPRNAALILSGLWLLLFFAALFSPPVLDDADATHAQAARAIATTGDLVTLNVDGVRYLEKAPLPYWLTALSFSLFGFNTFADPSPASPRRAPAHAARPPLGQPGLRRAHRLLHRARPPHLPGTFLFTRILIPEVLLSLFLATALFAFLKALGPISADPESSQGWVPQVSP